MRQHLLCCAAVFCLVTALRAEPPDGDRSVSQMARVPAVGENRKAPRASEMDRESPTHALVFVTRQLTRSHEGTSDRPNSPNSLSKTRKNQVNSTNQPHAINGQTHAGKSNNQPVASKGSNPPVQSQSQDNTTVSTKNYSPLSQYRKTGNKQPSSTKGSRSHSQTNTGQ